MDRDLYHRDGLRYMPGCGCLINFWQEVVIALDAYSLCLRKKGSIGIGRRQSTNALDCVSHFAFLTE